MPADFMEELNKLNHERAVTVHPNNLKRVIRYIEIETNHETLTKSESILNDYQVLCVGVVEDREVIYSRINARVDKMIEEGLEQEVENLINLGASSDMQAFNSIGYQEWFDYFNEKTTKDETINLIKQHTRNYCKRQLTFLKTIKNIDLCSLCEAENKIRSFLND